MKPNISFFILKPSIEESFLMKHLVNEVNHLECKYFSVFLYIKIESGNQKITAMKDSLWFI